MGRATCKLRGPFAQATFDIAESSVPIHCSSTECGLAKGDSLVVTKSDERFNVSIVTKPTPRDHVMVEVRKSLHEVFDPRAEVIPLPPSLNWSEIRPMERARDPVGVVRPFRLEHLCQSGDSLGCQFLAPLVRLNPRTLVFMGAIGHDQFSFARSRSGQP